MDLLSELQHAEFKEAFDEFDKVRISTKTILVLILQLNMSKMGQISL